MTSVINPKRTNHDSYGVISVERIGGYTAKLNGSVSGSHHTAFRLRISRAERSVGLGGADHWSAIGKPIAEIHLSAWQLFEVMALQGMGMEVPVTLVRVMGEQQPDPPERDSALERVIEESRDRLFNGPDPSDEAIAEIDALRQEIQSLKVSKAVKASLDGRLSAARQKLREPGIVAHLAVERAGELLHAAATQARVEARLSPPHEEMEDRHATAMQMSLVGDVEGKS